MGARGIAKGVVLTSDSKQTRFECVPLYAMTDTESDVVEFLGTGTLIRVQGRDLLVTAAHVIQNGKKYTLMIAGPEEPLLLKRSSLVTPIQDGLTRESDPLDFCVIRLTPEETVALRTRCRFVEWENDALMDMPLGACPHRMTGYTETDAVPNYQMHTLPIIYSRIDVMEDRRVVQHAPWPGVKAHPTWHIGMRYDPRLLKPQQKRPKIKSLHGCSGGAIWRTDGDRVLGFAGIVVQCQSPRPRPTGERIIFGFRAKAMDDLLMHWIAGGHV